MNLALGTAQFGMNYGAVNSTGQPSLESIATILEVAKELGIDTIDTAMNYGNSEEKLGLVGVTGWNIITKIPHEVAADDLEIAICCSMKRLKIEKLSGVLLHDADDLCNAEEKWWSLVRAKEAGLISRIGVSVYDADQLHKALEGFEPDIIQAPLNLFDQRLIHEGWVEKLVARGIELHARSLFLQGTLLSDINSLNPYFLRWSPAWQRLDAYAASQGVSRLAACLSIAKIDGVTKAVVGVDSPAQLRELGEAFERASNRNVAVLAESDMNLVDPRRWRL